MNELIKVNYDNPEKAHGGRRPELRGVLGGLNALPQVVYRMCGLRLLSLKKVAGFLDKCPNPSRTVPAVDHALTIPMAKELCMLQRNESGASRPGNTSSHWETAWNTPEQVMASGVKAGRPALHALRLENSALTVENQIAKPQGRLF